VASVWREGYVPGGETRFFVRALGSPDWREPGGEGGAGDDLAVLLHGWPQDGSSWRLVAPLLHAAGYRVVCPDLKGFGRSDRPRRGYDPRTLGDEISQLIRNLHARKAVLVGHDWGGAVALATAFRHPGRVRALATVSSPFRQIDLSAAWHIPLLNVPILPEVAFKVAGTPLTKAIVRHAAVVQDPYTDEVLERYAAAVSETPSGWLAYYRRLSRRAMLDWGVRRVRRRVAFLREPAEPHRLRVPTVVVWGEEDPATPVHLATRVAHDLDADLVVVPGVGHFVHEEAPEVLAQAVLDLAGPAVPEAPTDRAAASGTAGKRTTAAKRTGAKRTAGKRSHETG
jgi:epoxide hydrolase 4